MCGAFGGLSETHHEILVLRELEGLSYSEIGRRMGMSRPAVESTLFRARRRLTEEYDDIVSGARCLRIQSIIQIAAQSPLGARDTRRLARHLAHCQPCRREALEAGLDRSLIARPTVRERVRTKVAALLPFPVFLRLRRGAEEAPPSGRGAGLARASADDLGPASGGWGKLAAGAALLVAGVGAGVGAHHVATAPDRPVASSHHVAATHAAHGAAAPPASERAAAVMLPPPPPRGPSRRPRRHKPAAKPAGTHPRRSDSSGGSGATTPAAPPPRGGSNPAAAGSRNAASEAIDTAAQTPGRVLPTSGSDAVKAVGDTTSVRGRPDHRHRPGHRASDHRRGRQRRRAGRRRHSGRAGGARGDRRGQRRGRRGDGHRPDTVDGVVGGLTGG